MALTLKQQLFVRAYLSNGGNATSAARSAGYKGNDDVLESVGRENLGKPRIAEAIKAGIEKVAKEREIMPAGDVLALLTEQAGATLEDFIVIRKGLDGEEFTFSLAKAKRRKKLHLLKSVKSGKDGMKLEMYDAQAAAVQLGKYHGLFTDVVVVQEQAAEWAGGFVQDAIGVLREFITDDDNLAKALDALKSRMAARLGRGGHGRHDGDDRGSEVPNAAVVG